MFWDLIQKKYFLLEESEILGKGKLRFCYECAEFPCKMLKSLDKRYRSKYNRSMIENLVSIRDNGMEKFLKKEEAKWRCSQCGGVICCHNGLGLDCNISILLQNKKYHVSGE